MPPRVHGIAGALSFFNPRMIFAKRHLNLARFAARLPIVRHICELMRGGSAASRGEDCRAVSAVVAGLAGMVEGMEERFVPLGEDLGSIVGHLQSLTRATGDGFAAIREEISSGALGNLEVHAGAALDLLRHRLAGAARRMQPLADVAGDLHRLHALGNDVRQIGAFLQACGSSFAVESVRREESRAVFAAFVQELRALANQIGELAERMDEDSRATLAQLGLARNRIGKAVSELDGLARTMEGAFATAAGEIERLLGGMRQVLDRVERHRLGIAEKTGGVIYYLQFGDLVRQKCEHVLVAAREAEEVANSRRRESLPIIVRTCAAQLELIQREVDESRGHLARCYAALERELTELAACGQALAGGEDGQSDDAWSRLQARLGDLEIIQQKEERLNLDAAKSAGEAGASAAALQASLGPVREMSSHLHLLALNAIIQTVHLGAHGRTLEMLAQHVDALHRTCEALVPQVLGLLEDIAGRVATFTDHDTERGALTLDRLRQFESAQRRSRRVMEEVTGLASVGEDLLRAAVGRLETLDTLSSEIDAHRAELLRIAQRLPAPADASAAADFDTRMLQRYTMQSERSAHQHSRGMEPVESTTEAIEFFSLPAEEPRPDSELVTAPAGDGGLGDNIELF